MVLSGLRLGVRWGWVGNTDDDGEECVPVNDGEMVRIVSKVRIAIGC